MASKKEEKAASGTLKQNAKGHGYKYTDMAAINEYIAELGETYRQEVESAPNGYDYIITIRMKDDKDVLRCRGCRIPTAKLPQGNPAQEYGSAVTYARRYSLLMAYGLATEDDDAETFSQPGVYSTGPSYAPPAQAPQKKITVERPWRRACMQLANANQIALEDVSLQYGLKPNDTEENYKRAYEQMQKDLNK